MGKDMVKGKLQELLRTDDGWHGVAFTVTPQIAEKVDSTDYKGERIIGITLSLTEENQHHTNMHHNKEEAQRRKQGFIIAYRKYMKE